MTEKEYIEREKVLALQTDLHFDNIEQLKYWKCRHIDPIEVQLLPAADVQPVVFCKDCKHKGWVQEPEHGKSVDYCHLIEKCVDKRFFCAAGEKRQEPT